MIRVFLISAAFLSVTIALLVIQPGPDPRAPVEIDAAGDVTRATGDLTDLSGVPSLHDAPVETTPVSDDALGFGLSDSIAPEPSAGANNILTQLQQPATSTRTDTAEPMVSSSDDPLEALVIRALSQGQSEGYIDALVNHAAQTGDVTVPDSLITPDGRVDTGALLSALSPAATRAGPGKGTYTVQPGDTLASIAYRFYGQTSARQQIFDANKDRINASGHLEVGLELVLPAN